jgi:hypothetical protein
MSIHLSSSYETILNGTVNQTVSIPTSTTKTQAGEILHYDFEDITIPPLNSINIFNAAPPLDLAEADSSAAPPPPSFSWVDRLPSLTKPFNQGKCGCCWSVAVSSVLSDIFQISGIIPFNPEISSTYLLSCSPRSLQCGGGNPYLCLAWIESNGAGTDKTVNFDWCLEDSDCNPSARTKKRAAGGGSTDLNSLIPVCDQIDTKNRLLFFARNTKAAALTAEDAEDPKMYDACSLLIKRHILSVGPVVGGYHVYSNLFYGRFQSKDNPAGIYFESVNYSNSNQPPRYVGSHAVSIVGWGVDKVRGNVLGRDPSQWYEVPYWWVRNSWTEKWGEGGFYKHARYPFNRKSQFDTTVTVTFPGGSVPTNGIIMTFPGSISTMESYTSPRPHRDFIMGVALVIVLLFLWYIIIMTNKKK